MLDGRVILFENPDDSHDPSGAPGYRKSHGICSRGIGKFRAQPPRISEIAKSRFRRAASFAFPFEDASERRSTGAPLPFPQRSEKRTGHLYYPIRLEPTRIEILQQLLDQNPASTFARYGLAMEYVKSGDLDRAVAAFDEVTKTDPNYSAAYFHGGQTLEKLGKLDEARDFYRRGIAVTRDPHARSELEAALDILGE
jgi:tetratricopeptide (TPR) repeat protein